MLSSVEKIVAFVTILCIVTQLYLHKHMIVDVSSNIENEVIFGNDNFGDESVGGNDISYDVNIVTDADLEEVHQNTYDVNNVTDADLEEVQNKKCEGLCTAELLFDGKENFPWEEKDDGGVRWNVTKEAQSCCQLENSFLEPLQSSSEDIQNALEKKWLLMMGDSSVRMAFEYLTGRWLSSWTDWPEGLSKFGMNPVSCAGKKHCFSDFYVRGARVTFVWFSQNLNSVLKDFLSSQVGVPNVIVAEHGYWERDRNNEDASLIYSESVPKKILEILDMNELDEFYPKGFTVREKQRHVWLTTYDKRFWKNREVARIIDGTHGAKESGWDIFDRTKLVDRNGKAQGAHPLGEVLQMEVEILLQIMKNLPIE